MCTCPWCFLLIRRILWLSIWGKEADIWSMFHFSTPLPQVSGCVVVEQVLDTPQAPQPLKAPPSFWGLLFTTQGP